MTNYLHLIDTDTPGPRCDVTPIFADYEALSSLIKDILAGFADIAFDCVAGIDALGFILGTAVAQRAKKGFLPIRKGGKLPVPSDEIDFVDYTGRRKSLELRASALHPGTRVLIVDEWVETGAQVSAAVRLVESQGGVVAGIATIQMDENPVTRALREKYTCCVAGEIQTEKEFLIIRTERLILRSPSEQDIPKLLHVSQDEAVMRYFGMEPFETKQDALKEIGWFNRIFADSQGIRWIICEKDKDEYIGDIGFHNYSKKHARAEIGYRLSRPFWRKGIMTEALSKVLEYGYRDMALNRIEALVDPRNTASLKLLEKQQFKTEGILRQYEREREEYVNLAMLSLLKEEWLTGHITEEQTQ